METEQYPISCCKKQNCYNAWMLVVEELHIFVPSCRCGQLLFQIPLLIPGSIHGLGDTLAWHRVFPTDFGICCGISWCLDSSCDYALPPKSVRLPYC